MLNLYEMEHLAAFAEYGTLSKVSEKFHISPPTITRSMQHLEEAFGVSLFNREKNRISLNPTGMVAAEQAKTLLEVHAQALETVRQFDRNQRVIRIKSCAPAPLWTLIPEISGKYPENILETELCSIEEIEQSLNRLSSSGPSKSGQSSCIYVLPYEFPGSLPYSREKLYISVKKEHQLASCKSVSFSDINGFNFLLRSEIGFWDSMCRQKMPSSRFLVQKDNSEYDELAANSMLPCFVTDLGMSYGFEIPGRISIPISDSEANVTFYMKQNF